MGGSAFTAEPTAYDASDIEPFQFSANWSSVKNATGYYIDVYTKYISLGDTLKKFVSGYENFFLTETRYDGIIQRIKVLVQ
jgi:hypothetical protein